MKGYEQARRVHPCVRCGIDTYRPHSICNDCRQADRAYVRMVGGAK